METDTISQPADAPVLRWGTAQADGAAKVSAEQIHDLNGPSQLEKRFHCPGSARLEALAPERETEQAERGTNLHALIAACRTTGSRDPLVDLSPNDREACEFILDNYDADMMEGAVELVEHRVDLSQFGIPQGGTVDHAWVIPGVHAVMHDPKMGDRPVKHPKNNWQMIGYALGLVEDFGVQEVTAIILRPAAEPEWQRMVYTFTAADLARLADDLREIIRATLSPDAALTPGGHCTFCRAKDTCPARWALVPSIPRHATFDSLIKNWSPFDRRSMYERAKIARQQISALIARMEALCVSGECPITGYGATDGRETRTWCGSTTVVEETLRQACKLKGVEYESLLTTRELMSPAQVEKVLGKSAQVKKLLDGVIAKVTGEKSFGRLA